MQHKSLITDTKMHTCVSVFLYIDTGIERDKETNSQ